NETEELNLDADTEVIAEDKGSGEKGGSTVSTATPDIETLVKMKDNKAKGVVFKDTEELVRPARSILTLKPLPSIDLKDKGKGVLEEPKPAKKMTRSDFDAAQVARDAEVARQLEVELQAGVERVRQREKQASMDYIANLYDEVQERIDAGYELVVRLTHEEQEKYIVDGRTKLLAEFFERRKKQLSEERATAIRNKPLTRTQLRSLMMTYLKHTEPDSTKVEVKQEVVEHGTKKTSGKVLKMKARKKARKPTHADSDNEHNSKKDEKNKKDVVESSEKGTDASKKRKGGPRMIRQSKRKKTDSDLEEEGHLKTFLKIVSDEEGIIDFEVLEKRFPIINWESKFYHFDRHGAECIYYRIFRSDGSSRWIKTFYEMVTRFDRLDLVELYNLVMQRFKTTTPEGVDLVLWGDLRTSMQLQTLSVTILFNKECEECLMLKLNNDLYDEQMEQLGDASIEIQAYTLALKNCAQYHKKLLAEAVKEKEELKTKLENFQSSSKGLSKLQNILISQTSAKDKSGLGYGDQIHEVVWLTLELCLNQLEMNPKSVCQKTQSLGGFCSGAPIIEEFMREMVKEQKHIVVQVLEADKRDGIGLMSKKLSLGFGFTKKGTCFVCGSFIIVLGIVTSMRKEWHYNRLIETEQKGQGYLVNDERNKPDDPQKALKNKGIVNSGCSRHMTGNKAYLFEYQDYNGGPVAFGGSKGQITGKDKIITGKLDFEDVCKSSVKQKNGDEKIKESTLHSSSSSKFLVDPNVSSSDRTESGIKVLELMSFVVIEPKKISEALEDKVRLMLCRKSLLQFKIRKFRFWDIDKRKGMTMSEVLFAPLMVRIEAIRIFLAFASYILFIVYQMDVKSAFLYGTIDEELYVSQPPGFVDPKFPKKVQQKEDGIFISQDKYVAEILKKFDFATVKSMIGSLMYLTASRPDIMFAVCACSRFQVTPKTSHLNAVKRIFRYLKGKPKLGLWYPRVSSFDLEAYSDSDYAGANLDRKSTTGGCQFLGRRLISWQCKKQTIVATSTTEAEYVAAANCCGQVLWIQNQMLDYGFNFMNTKIYIDNESTICIVKNPVFHSKTKHIEIRHHFIRDAYEKKLIQVLKIHTDDNVADLLTKAFDVSSTSMADLEFVDQHNLVVCLEKTGGNSEFHEIVDFLTSSLIHHALTAVVVTKASIRSSLLLNDVDGDHPLWLPYHLAIDTTQDFRGLFRSTNGSEGDQVLSSYGSCLETSMVLKLQRSLNEGSIKKLKKGSVRPSNYIQAWLKSVKVIMKKRDYMETEDVVKEGRQSNETEELNKGSGEKGGSTKELVSTARPKTVSTARPKLSTARPDVDTVRPDVDAARPDVDATRQEDIAVEPRTPPTITSIFDDEDITMTQTLIKMKEEKAKEKRVSIKDIEDSSRHERSILTLKPLPTINPKDKGKSVLEEPEPAKKMTRSDFDAAQIARDAEIARQLQVDLQAEVERERQREEEASKAVIAETYDEVQAGIDADALATQRSAEIRSRPPTKSQLRNLMMTYLKNMGSYKYSQLKAKTFAEIQGLYERQKRVIDDFKPMDSDDAVKDSKEAAVKITEVFKEPTYDVEVRARKEQKIVSRKRIRQRL
ncbi:putative ribonuclease H-like domain-containing protein, partial [Tanacetum coccineum]